MYKRWMAGEFGNAIKCWLDVDEFFADVQEGRWPKDHLVCLRYRGKVGGSPICWYDIHPSDMQERVAYAVFFHGAERSRLVVNDSDDTGGKRTLQGEVQLQPGGWYLMYTNSPLKMREAFKVHVAHAFGLTAKLLLDKHMDATSRDWLDELMALYPGHVVEFTCLERVCGTLGWNTLFWELRKYIFLISLLLLY